MRNSKNVRRSSSGAVMVEAAVGTLVFFTILVAGLDCVLLSLSWSRLHYSVFLGQRYANLMVPSSDRLGEIRQRVQSSARNLGGVINTSDIKVCKLPEPTEQGWAAAELKCSSQSAGNSRDYITVQADAQYRSIWLPKTWTISAQSFGKNEPGPI